MTQRRYVTVDVFTDTPLQGNPVAVVLDAEGLSAGQMQAVTREFNYSETTFVLPPRQPGHDAWVRIFTPGREIPFAGHPNVGTAFALARERGTDGARPQRFVFEEAAGTVPVELLRRDGAVVGAELTAPEPLSRRGVLPREQAAACLSLPADDIRTDAHAPQVVSVGLPFLVAEVASRAALGRIKPNADALHRFLPLDGASSVYAYTRDIGAAPPWPDLDLQARMVTSRLYEDPATGSATAAATALLAELRGTGDLSLRVAQGVDMGRASLLLPRVRAQGGATTVHVGGACVMAMTGTFRLAGEA